MKKAKGTKVLHIAMTKIEDSERDLILCLSGKWRVVFKDVVVNHKGFWLILNKRKIKSTYN